MDVSPIDSVQNGPTSLCTNRQLSRLLKTLSINVEFQNLTYSVKNNGYKSETIEILKSIHGVFQAGHLTGILGPSGSGKTTLLNILSGYISSGSSGIIKVNGKLRQMETFRKVSAYIMQEDAIPNFLSVDEIMMLSAKLKLGNKVPLAEKEIIIKEILTVLGLQNCNRTRTENLSGGERKRLSIALELVNNPPIIFLDEPTTGLDTVAAKQCIDTLNILSSQGRTVICTIHQPPSSLCQNFNQLMDNAFIVVLQQILLNIYLQLAYSVLSPILLQNI